MKWDVDGGGTWLTSLLLSVGGRYTSRGTYSFMTVTSLIMLACHYPGRNQHRQLRPYKISHNLPVHVSVLFESYWSLRQGHILGYLNSNISEYFWIVFVRSEFNFCPSALSGCIMYGPRHESQGLVLSSWRKKQQPWQVKHTPHSWECRSKGKFRVLK